MSTRRLPSFRLLALVATASLFLTAIDVTAGTLKIATLAPGGSSWIREMKAAGDRIAKATDGRVKLKFYPGGVMGNDKVVMRKALFSESASDAIFNRLWDQVCDESFVASSEVQGLRSFAPQPGMKRPAVFVGGAADDRFIPSAEVCRTAAYYGVEAVMVEDLAHLVMIDTNWEDMAKPLLSWIKEL